MSTISNDPETAANYLSEEARFLIEFGRRHPQNASRIGRLVFAYHQVIQQLKKRCAGKQSEAA